MAENKPGLLARILRASPENPRTSLSKPASWLFDIFRSSTGIPVDETSAITLSAVWASVRIISETLASIPVDVYYRDGETRRRASEHPVSKLIAHNPNKTSSSFTFRETLAANLCLHGNAYAIIVRDAAARPIELVSVHPNRVKIKVNKGEKFYTVDDKKTYSDEEMLHFVGLSFDGVKGQSPLDALRDAIGMGIAAQQFGAEFFANGANMGGVLTHPGRLTDDQIKRLKDSWNRSNAGLGKSNGTAVLEEGMKYERIGIPPDAAQFLQSRRFTVEDIARAFRVPPAMLAEMSNSSTRANVEEQAISFVRDTMNPYIARFETEFNRKLFREDELGTYYVRFTVDGLLRGDIKTRYSSYSIARQWGWLSVNDIRDLENLNPIEGGDTYLSPLNMAPVAESPSNLGEDAD